MRILTYWPGIAVVALSLLAVYFTSCSQPKYTIVKSDNGYNFIVVKIDGCEYIEARSAYGYFSYAHKGNCSNPIHIYNTNK